jgi:hypothetical protein
MKIIENQKVEVVVRRPDGKLETLIHPKISYMTDGLLKQVNQAMKAANRGEIISYRNIDAVVEMEESDYMVKCERCGKTIDSRTSYSQKEWTRYGGQKVQVKAHYCKTCEQILKAMRE